MSLLNKLEECFERDLLRYVEPSGEKAQESIKLAKEWLEESIKNFNSGAYRSGLSSAYLAIFHSARAILFNDGVRERSHYCVGVYLEKYVDKKMLEGKWVEIFDRIRSARHTDQYSFTLHITAEEVENSIEIARDFITRMQKLLEEIHGRGV